MLIVQDVCKVIKGKALLSHINAVFEEGNVYGFVGNNGAGKTMLFRALSGLINVTKGEIRYNGKILHKDMEVLPNLGIMIENAGLYPELSGLENLKQLAKLNNKIGEAEIVESIYRVGLNPKEKKKYRKYSLGMKQRIIFAQAIMEKPDILLLDEPTNALDDEGRQLFRNIIMEEKERGAIILIASHAKDEINCLADHIYHVSNGCISQIL